MKILPVAIPAHQQIRIFTISVLCTLSGLVISAQNLKNFDLSPRSGFIENKGQLLNQHGVVNEEVQYLWASARGMNVQLRPDGISYDTYVKKLDSSDDISGKTSFSFHRLDMDLLGANKNCKIIPSEPQSSPTHFYRPNSPNKSSDNALEYNTITYKNIYDNIDMVVKRTGGTSEFKYDFILNPGANIADIQLEYKGFDEAVIDNGALAFTLSGKELSEHIPLSWTLPGNVPAEVQYRIDEQSSHSLCVGFEAFSETEPGHILVVDPLVSLQWSSYYGDSLYDVGNSIATDSLGNIFIAGTTESLHSMASAGSYQSEFSGGQYDAFLVKFNQHGLRHWATYYGGTGDDQGMGVCVDAYENVFMVGHTTSADSIGSEVAFQDSLTGLKSGFLAKFNRLGELQWDTYIGGENEDEAIAVVADPLQNVFVTGNTRSATLFDSTFVFPQLAYQGETDGFIAGFNETGELFYGTYFGGEADDYPTSIDRDNLGNIYLTGFTSSASGIATTDAFQPALSGDTDAFAAKFNASAERIWSGYYGGQGLDVSTGIAFSNGLAYITGYTDMENEMPTDSAWQSTFNGIEDAFIAALDSTGSIVWYTFFGGEDTDRAAGISVDYDGQVYIVGTTRSTESIIMPEDSLDMNLVGGSDVFIAKFDTAGTRLWSQYFGGTADEEARGIAAFGFTAIFFTGKTNSTDSIAIANGLEDIVHQSALTGDTADAFVARLTQIESTTPSGFCAGECPFGNDGGDDPPPIGLCAGDSLLLSVSGGCLGLGADWVWYVDSCGVTDLYIGDGLSIWVSPDSTTNYYVRSENVDRYGSCTGLTVHVDYPPTAEASIPDSICPGTSTVLSGSGATFYAWAGPNDFSSEDQNAGIDSLSAINEGIYSVVVTTQFGCMDTAYVELSLLPSPQFDVIVGDVSCPGFADGSIEIISTDTMDLTYSWGGEDTTATSFGDLEPGSYAYTVTNPYLCSSGDLVSITEPEQPVDSLLTKPAYCNESNGSISLYLSGTTPPYEVIWSPDNATGTELNNMLPGIYTAQITDVNGCLYEASGEIDNLGFFSASIDPDSIYLEINTTSDLEVYLNPEPDGPTYQWLPEEGLSCTVCPNPVADPAISTWYTATVTSVHGCSAADSIFVEREIPPSLPFVPSIFSPNSDGLNDQLCILGNEIVEMNLQIYNRWGEEVFVSKSQENCWNGEYGGKPVESGTFVYAIKLTLEDGEEITESGNINIIR